MIVHTLRRTISTDFTSESSTTVTFFDGRTMTDVKPEPCIHPGIFADDSPNGSRYCPTCRHHISNRDL